MKELELLQDADSRARKYVAGTDKQDVFPDANAIDALSNFDEQLTDAGAPDEETIALLDESGSPATAVSNGPGYLALLLVQHCRLPLPPKEFQLPGISARRRLITHQ